MLPSHRIHTITVLRALQLGDTLCAIPALRLLRARFPAARISLVALPWARELVTRYPELIDELVAFPGFPGIPEAPLDSAGLRALLAAHEAEPVDLAVQLQGSGGSSNAFISLLGARQAIGSFLPGEWRPGPGFIPYRHDLPEPHRLTAVIRHLVGGEAPDPPLTFPVVSGDVEALTVAIPDLPSRPYVCIHPGSRHAGRRWPAERFAAIGDALARRGYRVLLTGVADERSLHAEVRSAMAFDAESLAGRLDLGGFAALLAGTRLLVTNDTGASHLAAAIGAPSVVIFTGSDPARWAPADRARHHLVGGVVTRGPEHCCLHESCSEREFEYRDVTVSDVVAAMRAHLGDAPPTSGEEVANAA